MTLMAAGFQPESKTLKPAMGYLSELNTKRHTTFFWRSGPLLNVDGYERVVSNDIDHLLRLRERAGGSPEYPAMFFLLKLLRFQENSPYHERIGDTVDWILSEWTDENCWYGSTSLTSMGLALLADLDAVPKSVVRRSEEFLVGSFGNQAGSRSGYSSNLIDDAYTAYNLFERFQDLEGVIPAEVFEQAQTCIDGLMACAKDGMWTSDPPFGGAVDSDDYATAVITRAAIARELAMNPNFEIELSAEIAGQCAHSKLFAEVDGRTFTPFWGPLNIRTDPFCFVAMPFEDKRTEIYNEYVKTPIEEQLGVSCERSNDITRSTKIMENIWDLLQSCSVVIADISGSNPNVFYELGFAHAIGKPVVLIVENIDEVPFDVGSIRIIPYGDRPSTWKRLSERVVQFVKSELPKQ